MKPFRNLFWNKEKQHYFAHLQMPTQEPEIKLDPLWCSWFLLSAKPHFLPDMYFKVLQHSFLKYWSIHCFLAGGFFCFTLHPIYSPLPLEGKNSKEKNILSIQYMHTKGKNSMIMEKQSNSDCFTTEHGASHAMWHLKYMNGIKAQEMVARTCSNLQVSIAVESKF